jgi:hypothetical protein
MDLDIIDDILLLLASQRCQEHQRMRTGQPGQEYMMELLDSAHPERVYQELRMRSTTFYSLKDWLLANTDLKGRHFEQNRRIRGLGKQVSIEEKLAIFIYITSRGASNRDAGERFSRSGHTISRSVYFYPYY